MRSFRLFDGDVAKSGLKGMGLGALLIIIVYIRILISPWKSDWFRIGGFIFGGFIILVGLVIVLLDVIPKIKKN